MNLSSCEALPSEEIPLAVTIDGKAHSNIVEGRGSRREPRAGRAWRGGLESPGWSAGALRLRAMPPARGRRCGYTPFPGRSARGLPRVAAPRARGEC